MIANHIIQRNILADLLAYTDLTDLLGSVDEIRESQYQGTDFRYPAVRLFIDNQKPILNREQCDHANLSFIVRAYTESGSSRECNIIANAIQTRLHRRNFHGDGWYSWFRCMGYNNPRRMVKNLWMGELTFNGVVYPRTAFVTPVP